MRAVALIVSLVAFAQPLLHATPAAAAIHSHLQRIEVRSRDQATRLLFKLDRLPPFSVTSPAERLLRLRFTGTTSPLFRKLRSIADHRLTGIIVRHRMGDLVVDIAWSDPACGFRLFPLQETAVLAVELGPRYGEQTKLTVLPGREQILKGAEKLVREFEQPLVTTLPFVPTVPQTLARMLRAEEVRLFQAGESALFKGRDTDAEEIFSRFPAKEPAIRGLVAYRLGEARYALQKYELARQAFSEGERLSPQFLAESPGTAYAFADSLVRSGDLAGGRRLLGRLLLASLDKPFAPLFLVRFADVLSLQGREQEAMHVYRTVIEKFPGSRGAQHAAMQLADRRIFSRDGSTHELLVREFRTIREAAGEFSLKDEALFKEAFLESLYGPGMQALSLVAEYERRFPRGVFGAVARSIREELLVPVSREVAAAGDQEGLVRLARDNRNYLALCLGDGAFPSRLTEAFAATGMLRAQIELFTYLAERYSRTPQAPFLLGRAIDAALQMSELRGAEDAAQRFFRLFPENGEVRVVREKLAAVKFQKGDLAGVGAELSWLLNARERAVLPVSYYYLGKALAGAGRSKEAAATFRRFVDLAGERREQSPYLMDAYYGLAAMALAAGDHRGAAAALRSGLTAAGRENRPQFLYKLGELELRERRPDAARRYWEQLLAEGGDPDWQKMALQAIEELAWPRRLAGRFPLASNK